MNQMLDKESIKKDIIEPMFNETSNIGEYGTNANRIESMKSVADMMENSPISRLADKVKEIVSALNFADPEKVSKEPSKWQKLFGKHTETIVMYQSARISLEKMIEDGSVIALQVKDAIKALDTMISEHNSDIEDLHLKIEAGKEYLIDNPNKGINEGHGLGGINFESPRDRFARKLVNLETLVSSHLFSIAQMKLARAQAVDLLDRYLETTTLLVPVWRQTTLAMVTSSNMSPDAVKAATTAHQNLLKSLSQTAL